MSFPDLTLNDWFQQNKRSFPWRKNPHPYAVWVSEVMLQQTRASVVVDYFKRWMERFPTIEDLAKAEIDEVIKLWEGLGYYQRARNLHAGSKQILECFQGSFPRKRVDLEKIKGLGPYTVAAILAFAYGEKCIPIDGNVMRVFSRYFLIKEDISLSRTKKLFQQKAEEVAENTKYHLGEALIELGATVCTKNPSCFSCPLKKGCRAYLSDLQKNLPYKEKKITYVKIQRAVFIYEYDGGVYIKKNAEKLMQDLFEFPYISLEEKSSIYEEVEKQGLLVEKMEEHAPIFHTFTRFRVTLYPIYLLLKKKPLLKDYQYRKKSELSSLSFSSGHKKILERIVLC